MFGGHGGQDRAMGVWGSRAYAWSGEERPRAAGFPIDPSGRQRVLGFPADSAGVGHHDWFPRHDRFWLGPVWRRRLVKAAVAILREEGRQGRSG